MSTLTLTRPDPDRGDTPHGTDPQPTGHAPRRSRAWAGLRAVGRCVVDHLATDNGWLWAWGMGCPYPFPEPPGRYSGRADDQQP